MPGPPQRIDDFSLTCAADTAVISDVRQGFAAWLRRFVPDTETVDDMALVLSELLANAVSATDDDDGTVHVLACLEEEAVVLAVRNPSVGWVQPDDRWDLDDPLRAGGRGLLIVQSLVDDLEVDYDQRAGTTTVRSRLALHANA